MHLLKSLIIWSVKNCVSWIPGSFLVSFANAFPSAWPLGCSRLSLGLLLPHPRSRKPHPFPRLTLFVDLNNSSIHLAQPSLLNIRSISSDPSSHQSLPYCTRSNLTSRSGSCFYTEILYQSDLHIDQYQHFLTMWVSDNTGVIFSYRWRSCVLWISSSPTSNPLFLMSGVISETLPTSLLMPQHPAVRDTYWFYLECVTLSSWILLVHRHHPCPNTHQWF